MKKVEEQKHFLALMLMPGNYAYIDISSLDISGHFVPRDLASIDTFTLQHTKEEIISSIKRANIVSSEYLNGTLVIADTLNHAPLEVIDKGYYNNFNIIEFLNSILNNKELLNTVINKFYGITKDNELSNSFKEALKTGDVYLANNIIFSIPYLTSRKYVIYLIELRNKELEEKNIKVLERDNKE